MPPRRLTFVLASPLVLLAIFVACGGDDDDGGQFEPGNLTDQQTVPTATPWQQPPEVVLLDPDNIQPLPPNAPNEDPGDDDDGEATPVPGEPGVCGETYTVISGDTTFGIADKCGVDAQAIIDLNPDIDPANLSVGQVLIMPEPAPDETEAP
jgi:hypothetical protein